MGDEKCKACKRALALDKENLCAYCELTQENNKENTINVNCGICKVIVEEDSEGLFCDVCNSWFHNKCNETPLNYELYALLNEAPDNVKWFCDKCIWKTEKWIRVNNSKHCLVQGRVVNINSNEILHKSNGELIEDDIGEENDENSEVSNDKDSEGIYKEFTEEQHKEHNDNNIHPVTEIKIEIDKDEWLLTEKKKKVRNIKKNKKRKNEVVTTEEKKEVIKLKRNRKSKEVVLAEEKEEVVEIKKKRKINQSSTQEIGIINSENLETKDMINILNISHEHLSNITDEILSVKQKGKHIRFKCNLCPKSFLYLENCIAHILRDHEEVEKPFKCKACNKTYSIRSWKRHLKSHSTSEKIFTCEVCDKKFKCIRSWKRHLKSHSTSEKPFACEVCDKKFKTTILRKKHMERIHATEKPFKCPECDTSFAFKRNLTGHMKTHIPNEDRPHACDQCDKRYNDKNHLKQHKMLHTGEYKAICEICGKCFSSKSNLEVHARSMHSDERPFKCEICGKGFRRKDALDLHIKYHKKIFAARCPICNFGAPSKGKLNTHIKTVHTNETFECEVCGNKYKTKWNLSKHKRGIRGSCKGFDTSETSVKEKRESKKNYGKHYENDASNQEDSLISFQETSIARNHIPTVPNHGNQLLSFYANSNNSNAYSTQYHGSLIPPNLRGENATVQTSHINF